MMKQAPRKSFFLWLFSIVLVLSAISLNFFNEWLNIEMSNLNINAALQLPKNFFQKEVDDIIDAHKVPSLRGDVFCRINLDPNRKFYQSVFFIEGVEIARYKTDEASGKIYDYKGTIPNGKVTFENVTKNTHGEEYYRDDKRHGWYREYYENDQLKKETEYFRGEVRINKEYFFDGIMQLEQDFTDALVLSENKMDVGVGKVYYRDGVLKYEWNITKSNEIGYNRSYNRQGDLMSENFFNKYGELIEK